ncbi:MAG: PadR family transcriptional regulator [Oscillospiraceae bacterium]|nr:PadR family transcriptional regulator [Oscillospiraceae bacterium]
MARDRSAPAGNTSMLVLALLKGREMYGYEIIEELERRSERMFRLKEGTLYPILHTLEKEKLVTAREAQTPAGRTRRYYRVTAAGLRALEDREREWNAYSRAVTAILSGT